MSNGISPGSLSEFIWNEKYRYKSASGEPIDMTVEDTFRRVARAIASAEAEDKRPAVESQYFDAMKDFEFIPAGRILAGAGTGRDVTLSNCYVLGTIDDSLEGIMHAVSEGAMTLKQGGGIGVDFSTLRPRGAPVKGVDSVSSGAVSFMDLWHSMCGTIMSAGSRRGAMMGTLRCDHPDIEEFVEAKQATGRLTNFNMSVLVTDEFMKAVDLNLDWKLQFKDRVYKTVRARDLWDKILKATYEFAEPGVIFIDRVNQKNLLRDIENIQCTNPCGEQPLPPYGACVLGSINVAALVRNPFAGEEAHIDFDRLKEVAMLATRFLDNVITVSKYPLEAQRLEAANKRRIGLGITGLADALIMLGYAYDSVTARQITETVTKAIADAAMISSRALAKEKGSYPLWNESHGPERRNSHLTSIAPTGTISCFAGNVSSGIEPVFDYFYTRNVLLPDGTKKAVRCIDYARQIFDGFGLKQADGSVWKTATELSTLAHLEIVAAAQKNVDSAISKTINCAPDMSFEVFKEVYSEAYRLGMKGCTTYRPSGVRGAVLVKDNTKKHQTEKPPQASNVVHLSEPMKRPEELRGTTYKIRPCDGQAVYVTINDALVAGQLRPFEVFFATKAVECQAWMTALSRMISGIFRKGGDISFVIEELTSVHDPKGGHWSEGKYVPSTAAAVGLIIKRHLAALGMTESEEAQTDHKAALFVQSKVKVCPKCSAGQLISRDGCWGCDNCSYSKCG